jgi:putative phage-type endonuclease
MNLHIGTEVHDQRSDEWREARLGRITASKIYDVLAKTAKGTYTAKRDDYAYQLAAERLTGLSTRFFTNDAMLWGTETEPQALEFYAEYYGYTVTEAPFIIHKQMAYCGASPDGIVNNEWLVEIKCTQTNTFLRIKHDKVPPPQYVAQCQMQMSVTGAPKVDLFFYDPRIIDPSKQFILFEIARDEEYILNLEHEVALFNELVESITKE